MKGISGYIRSTYITYDDFLIELRRLEQQHKISTVTTEQSTVKPSIPKPVASMTVKDDSLKRLETMVSQLNIDMNKMKHSQNETRGGYNLRKPDNRGHRNLQFIKLNG